MENSLKKPIGVRFCRECDVFHLTVDLGDGMEMTVDMSDEEVNILAEEAAMAMRERDTARGVKVRDH